MGVFCLIEPVAKDFIKKLKDGTLDLEKLSDMSSEDRRTEFKKITGDDETARQLNVGFESKLLLKNQQAGLKSWVQNAAGLKPSVKRDMFAKIDNLNKVLDAPSQKAFLSDLAEQKLGLGVSHTEASKIVELTNKIKSTPLKDSDGLYNVDHFQAMRDTQKYIQSLQEDSTWRHLVGAARNFLLASLKTPIKVVSETTLNRGVEGLIKKLVYTAKNGENPDFASQAATRAKEIYKQTGYNIASMTSMNEGNMFGDSFGHYEGQSGNKTLDKSSKWEYGLDKAKGALRVTGKALDRVVIHYAHGLIFSTHFNGAFAHSVDLESTAVAKAEGLKGDALKDRALELSKEANTIGTTDKKAAEIRAQAQQDAMRVTNTNSTVGAAFARGAKNLLNGGGLGPYKGNELMKKLRLGDLTVPFSSIPANIITNAIGVAGGDLPMAAYGFKKAFTAKYRGEPADFRQPVKQLVRVIGSFSAATLISSQIPLQNYDEKDGKIKIGNQWVSTELFGLLGPAINGMMQARKASGIKGKLGAYGMGVAKSLGNLPVVKEIKDFSEYGPKNYVENFALSRLHPALFSDVYKSYEQSSAWPLLVGAKVSSKGPDKQDYGDAVRVGDLKKEDALKILQEQRKNGTITPKEFDARRDDLKLSFSQKAIKDARIESKSDAAKIDSIISATPPEQRNTLRQELQQKINTAGKNGIAGRETRIALQSIYAKYYGQK